MQRTITTLAKEQFGCFETFEVLERTYERRKFKEFNVNGKEEEDRGNNKFVFAQSNEDGRWHTGYLTFCTKF